MEYTPSFRDDLHADIKPSFVAHSFRDKHDAKMMYGLPKAKKFPMPDADHVRSAIKFFNYVTPAHEQQLASAILARMEEYGISADSLNVGDENRFKKYLYHDSLMHHGIKGQKWGVRRFQNPDGSLTDQGRKRYNKTYADTYEQLSAYKLFNNKARTVARKNAMDASEDYFRSITSTPEYKEISRLEAIPYNKKERDEYFKNHTKQDYYNERELAYAKNWQANKRIAKQILDKYADKTMKELKIKDKPGAKDAVKQILRDKNIYVSDIYNYDNPPSFKIDLADRFELMKADHPNLTYDKIYKEMNVDMSKEDNDYYKEIEDAYFKKHGY